MYGRNLLYRRCIVSVSTVMEVSVRSRNQSLRCLFEGRRRRAREREREKGAAARGGRGTKGRARGVSRAGAARPHAGTHARRPERRGGVITEQQFVRRALHTAQHTDPGSHRRADQAAARSGGRTGRGGRAAGADDLPAPAPWGLRGSSVKP